MAKATKPAAPKAPAKKAPVKTKASKETVSIEKASRDVLAKLKSLDLEYQLQSEIEWCLGSYQADGNPVGLYDMVNRSIPVFKAELQKKTKGVTAKWISELEASAAL